MLDVYEELELCEDGDYLQHYGILGMKWGVRRWQNEDGSLKSGGEAHYNKLEKKNTKLSLKAAKYDKRAAKYEKKSEANHAKNDLERSNRAAKRSANYAIKAAKYDKKATKTDSELAKSVYEQKSAKYQFKSDQAARKADRLSKMSGYNEVALSQALRSDKYAAKASKARLKIKNNQRVMKQIETVRMNDLKKQSA